jgi:heat shock protein 4
MQPKLTITHLKRLVGLKFSDPEVRAILPTFLFPCAAGPNDEILITAQYMGEEKTFTPERLVAMVLGDLKLIAERDHGAKCTDAVVSIPVFFTDPQRRAMLDACHIAGLNTMRLMHETTATALAYGIFKTAEFGDDPHNVVFVDVGHSALQVCVVRFTKSGLKILSTAFDRNLGGNAFDEAMFNHFCEEFKASKKIDIKTNARASLRLRIAIEKMKKILSSNPEAPLSIECLMDDQDVKSSMTRDKMEELSKGLLDSIMGPVQSAMSEAGMTPPDIKAVELVGNASRMPFIPTQLEAFFGMTCSRTLNASECVARGCALQGAMLSPQFKVRDFEVVDSFPFPVAFHWTTDEGEAKDMELFERNNAVPSTKMMTFFRNETFGIQAKYTTPTLLHPGADLAIGGFEIGPVPKPKNREEEKTKLKVKVRLNLNGLVNVESAQAVEETEEEVAVEAPAPAAADGDEPAAAAEPMETTKIVKKVIKTDVPVKSIVGGLPAQTLERFVQEEYDMALQDRVMEETKERKNAVEEYVYSMRSKVSGSLAPYAEPAVAEQFGKLLNDTEDWLYDEGEDETKGVYIAKLQELRALGDPMELRAAEESARPEAAASLTATAAQIASQAAPDAQHAHIDANDLASVLSEVKKATDWLAEKQALQAAQAQSDDPTLVSADIVKKEEALRRFARPILSRPRPAPAPPPAPEPEVSEPMDADGADQVSGEDPPPKADDLD